MKLQDLPLLKETWIVLDGPISPHLLNRVNGRLIAIEALYQKRELKDIGDSCRGNEPKHIARPAIVLSVACYGDSLEAMSLAYTITDKIRLFAKLYEVDVIVVAFGMIADAGLILINWPNVRKYASSQTFLSLNCAMPRQNLEFLAQVLWLSVEQLRGLLQPEESTDTDHGLSICHRPTSCVIGPARACEVGFVNHILEE